MALNPKRRVIPNRVLRRAVTRGTDAIYYGAKGKHPKKEKKPMWDEADVLTVLSITLMLCLVGIIIKSCAGG